MTKETTQAHLPGIPTEAPEFQDQKHTAEMRLFELALEQNGIEWRDEYAYFRGKGFSFRKAAVIAWLCMPKDRRIPTTKGELAKLLGLSNTNTILKIERDEAAQVVIFAYSQSKLLQHLAAVDDALVTSASNNDYKNNQDRKTFYQRLGLLQEKHEVKVHSVEDAALKQMSTDELRQLSEADEFGDEGDGDE